MKQRRVIRKSLAGGRRLCIGILNTVLALVLLLQATIITLSWLRMEIPVPESLYPKLHHLLAEQGVDARWDKLSVDLLAGVRVSKLEVFELQGHAPMLSADQIFLKINQAGLFRRELRLDRARVSNLTLYNNAIFSDDGTASPLIQKFYTDIRLPGKDLEIDHGIARIKQFSFSISGKVNIAFCLPPEESAEKMPESLKDMHLRLCREIEQVSAKLPNIEGGLIHIKLHPHEQGFNLLNANIMARSLKTDTADLENISLRIRDFVPGLQTTLRPVALSIGNVRYGELKGSGVRGFMDRPEIEHGVLSWRAAGAAATRVQWKDYTLDAPIMRLREAREDASIQQGRASTTLQGAFLEIEYQLNELGRQGAKISINSTLNVQDFFNMPFMGGVHLEKTLQFKKPQHIRTTLTFGPDLHFVQADFQAIIREMVARNAPFRYIDLTGQADPTGLRVSDLYARNIACEATGTYQQEWASSDYRMFLQGHIFPQDLNPVLGNWWDDIWENLQPSDTPFSGDVEVSGNWINEKAMTFLSARAANFYTLQGSFIRECTLKLMYRDSFIHGYDIVLTPEAGQATGEFGAFFSNDGHPWHHRIVIDLSGNTDISLLNRELELNLNGLLSDIQTSAPPEINIKANVVLHETGEKQMEGSFRLNTNRPLTVKDVQFDSLLFRGVYKHYKLKIDNLETRLGDGAVYGQYFLDKTQPETPVMQIKAEVHNALINPLYALISKQEGKDPIAGTVNGRIFLEGIERQPATYKGKGYMMLENAELGKIRMFGIFSRMFEALYMPIGVFNLDEATADFDIVDGVVNTPNLLVTGPNTTVEAHGNLSLVNDRIDMELKAFLLSPPEESLISLFGLILSPFGHFMEMNVSGTIADPQFNFSNKLNPFRLFESQSNGSPEVPGTEDASDIQTD